MSESLHPVVIKVGGEVFNSSALSALAADIAALVHSGTPIVLCHGGGPQATALQTALGQKPVKVAGRRVTDAETLDVIKMIVAGKLNVDACAALRKAGARPLGLHGASAECIVATKRPAKVYEGAGPDPIDLGHVGDVVSVATDFLRARLAEGYTPVLACLGADAQGNVFNINADTVANAVASALGAQSLVLVSDVRGVLRDMKDPSSRIAEIRLSEIQQLVERGVVTAGMVVKLVESGQALSMGVGAVSIAGQLSPGELRREVEAPGSIGTVLRP